MVLFAGQSKIKVHVSTPFVKPSSAPITSHQGDEAEVKKLGHAQTNSNPEVQAGGGDGYSRITSCDARGQEDIYKQIAPTEHLENDCDVILEDYEYYEDDEEVTEETAPENETEARPVYRRVRWITQSDQPFLPEGSTFDFSCNEVVPSHGDRPNPKYLERLREKKKTRGIANKHLQKEKPAYEQYLDENEAGNEDEEFDITADDLNEGADDTPEVAEYFELEEAPSPTPILATELPQTLDDREYNMVPEEIIRKDEV